mgnify:CR=1 FL=1
MVSNVEYVKMVYAMAIGYWIFYEIPDVLSVIGASVKRPSGYSDFEVLDKEVLLEA